MKEARKLNTPIPSKRYLIIYNGSGSSLTTFELVKLLKASINSECLCLLGFVISLKKSIKGSIR